VPVSVAIVGRQDVPVYLTGLGTVQASFTVGIHSQVDGKLQEVLFTEGQHVKKGDVLAKIDPRLFQAALDQAKAKKAQDQAQLTSAEKDLARSKTLVLSNITSQQIVDQQQAKVDQLLLVDNIIDQTTATIRLKAIFPNDDEKLWPGEFVNAHVLLDTRSAAVVIPSSAVQRGPNGLFVWTVTANNLAEPRPIEVGPTYQDLTVVASGLAGGERIVTDGQYKLQRNAPVAVSAPPTAAAGSSS
jgi:multidrug efflux pump subunit AcrA (membrane-fusion protein)